MAFHVNVEDDAVVTAELVGGVHGPVTLDADRIGIVRITDKDTQTLKIVSTESGISTTIELALTGLTLTPAPVEGGE